MDAVIPDTPPVPGAPATAGAGRPAVRRAALALFAGSLLLYAITGYGGLRSPDEEVHFRVGESLARGRGFTAQDLVSWPGFGLATGRDGRRYAVYGPLLSLAAAPYIRAVEALVPAAPAPDGYPLSYNGPDAADGAAVAHLLTGRPFLRDGRAHAVRAWMTFFNAAVTAAGGALLFLALARLLPSAGAALIAAVCWSVGSPAWSYAGTFFSEPLATTLLIGAFWALPLTDGEAAWSPRERGARGLAAGLLTGLAATAHLTAVLFAPFFAVYLFARERSRTARGELPSGAAAFAAGAALVLGLLGLFNAARFGSPLETGRGVHPEALRQGWYGSFVWSGEHLRGLLLGGHRSLFAFAPVTALALAGWPAFARRNRALAWALAAALVARLVFLGFRDDWHGGFGVGPRYLVMALPFLVLPLGFLLGSPGRARGRWAAGVAVVAAASAQQLYLALGEIFAYYHYWREAFFALHPEARTLVELYLGWEATPLVSLHRMGVGSWIARSAGLGFWGAYACTAVLLAAVVAGAFVLAGRLDRQGGG